MTMREEFEAWSGNHETNGLIYSVEWAAWQAAYRAGQEAYRKSLKPVAWMDEGLYEVLQEQGELRIGTIYTEKPNDSWLPLYRLDDQP
jgi:hypothetical protein